MYEIKASFTGMVPLMFDRFFNPEETEITKKKSKQAWKEMLDYQYYHDSNGAYIPSDSIRMMLIGNQFRKGSAYILGSYIEKKKGTEYLNFAKSCIWVMGETDPMKVYIQPSRTTFDDYDERTFVNATGSRSIKRRPIFKTPWTVEFIIQVTDDIFDQSKIRELFDVAGLRCGMGAYGPTFGRCLIDKWEILKK